MEWYVWLAAGIGSTSGTLSGIALILNQRRLRQRDYEDFLVRMRVLELDPTAAVLPNIADTRLAEGSRVVVLGPKVLRPPIEGG